MCVAWLVDRAGRSLSESRVTGQSHIPGVMALLARSSPPPRHQHNNGNSNICSCLINSTNTHISCLANPTRRARAFPAHGTRSPPPLLHLPRNRQSQNSSQKQSRSACFSAFSLVSSLSCHFRGMSNTNYSF